MKTKMFQSELNQALEALLEALKDYNRALTIAKQEADKAVLELIEKLQNERDNDGDRMPDDNEVIKGNDVK